MADETTNTSDLKNLLQEIRDLTKQVASLEVSKAKLESELESVKALKEKFAQGEETHRKAKGALEKEVADLKKQLETATQGVPKDEKDKTIADLQGQLLRRDHTDAFRSLIADPELKLVKIDPSDLMALVGHKPEGKVDLEAIKTNVLGLKEGKPFLFRPDEPPPDSSGNSGSSSSGSTNGSSGTNGNGKTPPRELLPPGQGSSRGAPGSAKSVAASLLESLSQKYST